MKNMKRSIFILILSFLSVSALSYKFAIISSSPLVSKELGALALGLVSAFFGMLIMFVFTWDSDKKA